MVIMHKKSIEALYKIYKAMIKISNCEQSNDKIHNFLNKMLTSGGGGGIIAYVRGKTYKIIC